MKKLFFIVLFFAFFSAKIFAEDLTGAGATFPYPVYSKMFKEYYKISGVKVNYQAIGSGGGIRQLLSKTVDFGASDAYVDDEDLKKFDSEIIHIPIVSGAVVLAYNIPGSPKLKLTPEIIAGIFLGKIKKWNNPALKKENPKANLPSMKIVVVHRSDGSGTTFIFTDYLCKVSKEWKNKVGRGKAVNWPVGMGAKGNPGVAGMIKQIPGTIGYIELNYAVENDINFAEVKNKSGNFVKPSVKSVELASDCDLPDDMRINLTNTSSKYGYPISGFTWILVYKDLYNGKLNRSKADALANLLWWMTHEGQKFALELNYAPLSENALKKTEKLLKAVNFNGESLLK